MKPWWTILVIACFPACTFTVSTDHTKNKPAAHGSSSTHRKSKSPEQTAIVNQGWIKEYRALESEHNYKLSNDDAVSIGDGKYRVTKSMLEHFSALSKAPPPTPIP